MIPRPPVSNLTAQPFPSPPLFRSAENAAMLMARIAVFAMLVVGGPVIRSVHMIGAMVVLGRVLRRPTSGRCRGRGSRGFLRDAHIGQRSEEHTSELQSLMRSSYAVFCLKNKTK